MNIKHIISEIISILDDVSEVEWSGLFFRYLNKIENPEYNSREIEKELLKLFGGMGSFNDLVLYQNDQLCFNQNVKLDVLRKKLFNILLQRRLSNHNEEE